MEIPCYCNKIILRKQNHAKNIRKSWIIMKEKKMKIYPLNNNFPKQMNEYIHVQWLYQAKKNKTQKNIWTKRIWGINMGTWLEPWLRMVEGIARWRCEGCCVSSRAKRGCVPKQWHWRFPSRNTKHSKHTDDSIRLRTCSDVYNLYRWRKSKEKAAVITSHATHTTSLTRCMKTQLEHQLNNEWDDL